LQFAVLPGAFCLAAIVSAAEPAVMTVENIARELGSVRQEIAALHDEINSEQQVFSDQLRSLVNQKNDLEIKISRNDLNIQDLQRELAVLREKQQQQSAPSAALIPELKSAIVALHEVVAGSLPFRLQDRLDVLAGIEHRLQTQAISPNKALNQVWAFVEDELTLGRSSGIYSETLDLSGSPTLARVLRIGKVALFYSTESGNYGLIRFNEGRWQRQPLQQQQQIAMVEDLFESYAKNIRTGLFTIPNYLPRN
jgi:hypothetical protein